MDNQNRILEIVRGVASKAAGKAPGKAIDPAPDESLFDSGLLDSFSLTDLVAALESEFSIRVPDADLTPRKFDSLQRIQSYIETHI
jgi:acyl carrier protein